VKPDHRPDVKGGGCENVSAQYSLPDQELNAGRDLNGVRKAALHAVWKAQGEGCAPGFLGIAVGGDRAASHLAAKKALLQDLMRPTRSPTSPHWKKTSPLTPTTWASPHGIWAAIPPSGVRVR
jgi:tartrate dehydratase alpha subunit/fumarate hydratase class I-like protein